MAPSSHTLRPARSSSCTLAGLLSLAIPLRPPPPPGPCFASAADASAGSATAALASQQPWRPAPGSASAVCCLGAARFRAGAPASVPLSLREPHPRTLGSGTLAFLRSGQAGVRRRREIARPPGFASVHLSTAVCARGLAGCGRVPVPVATPPFSALVQGIQRAVRCAGQPV